MTWKSEREGGKKPDLALNHIRRCLVREYALFFISLFHSLLYLCLWFIEAFLYDDSWWMLSTTTPVQSRFWCFSSLLNKNHCRTVAPPTAWKQARARPHRIEKVVFNIPNKIFIYIPESRTWEVFGCCCVGIHISTRLSAWSNACASFSPQQGSFISSAHWAYVQVPPLKTTQVVVVDIPPA